MTNEEKIDNCYKALLRMLDVWRDMAATFGPAKVLLTAGLNDGTKLILGESDEITDEIELDPKND